MKFKPVYNHPAYGLSFRLGSLTHIEKDHPTGSFSTHAQS